LALAPHYDLVATAAWREGDWPSAELTAPVGAAATFAAVRRADVMAFGEELGLPAVLGARLLDELLRIIEPNARALVRNYEASTGADPGEARLLRQILYGPVVQMTRQLR
jgi:serine/threonine-protein kinase HipA